MRAPPSTPSLLLASAFCFLWVSGVIELDNWLRDLESVSCDSAEFDADLAEGESDSAEWGADDGSGVSWNSAGFDSDSAELGGDAVECASNLAASEAVSAECESVSTECRISGASCVPGPTDIPPSTEKGRPKGSLFSFSILSSEYQVWRGKVANFFGAFWRVSLVES